VITLDTVVNCIIFSGNEGAKIVKTALEIGSIIESEVRTLVHHGEQLGEVFPPKFLSDKLNSSIGDILLEEEWTSAIKVSTLVLSLRQLTSSVT